VSDALQTDVCVTHQKAAALWHQDLRTMKQRKKRKEENRKEKKRKEKTTPLGV